MNMPAHYEARTYNNETKIWAGSYQSLSNLPHWHCDCEMFKVKKGSAELFMDGRQFSMKEGDCAFIHSGKIHFIHSSPQSTLSFIIYDFKITQRITDKFELASPILKNENFIKLYQSITAEIKAGKPFYNIMLKQLLTGEVINIFRNNPVIPKTADSSETSQRYKELLAEIDEKYELYTYEEAAAFIGFCPPYFSKYFKVMSGVTFTQYISRVRVEKAVEMIRGDPDLPMAAVAARCGFNTIRNFNRVFKSITGYTPKELPSDVEFLEFKQSASSDRFNPTQKDSILLND